MPRKRTPKELISETRRGFDRLEGEIESALDTMKTLRRELGTARGRVTRKRNSPYPNKFYDEIISQMKSSDIMPNFLMAEIDIATEENTEFARSAYKAALYSVAQDMDIYKLVKIGEGWNSGVSVQIVFEEEAGTLDDWAEGIDAYREELDTKQRKGNSRAGLRATLWWIQNVFGTGLEVITINRRIDLSNRRAPFWQLLNSGSQPLASDRADGSFNPISASPTDFIGHAEFSIRAYFLNLFLPEKVKWQEELEQAEEEVKQREEILRSYDYDLQKLTSELEQNQRIYDSFGAKKEFIDKNKLADVLERLRVGEKFERPQVELTRSGSGSRFRVRPSVRRLEGLLGY